LSIQHTANCLNILYCINHIVHMWLRTSHSGLNHNVVPLFFKIYNCNLTWLEFFSNQWKKCCLTRIIYIWVLSILHTAKCLNIL
jgi:hypothetical protein